MARFATVADRDFVEQEMAYGARDLPVTLYQFISRTRDAHPVRPAVSFQLQSAPTDPAITLTWSELLAEVTRTANLLRKLGIGENDVVAYMLPNSLETVATFSAVPSPGSSTRSTRFLRLSRSPASCARRRPRCWSR